MEKSKEVNENAFCRKKCRICKEPVSKNPDFCDDCLGYIEKLNRAEFYNEREYLEKLFIARFSNFLLVFSLIVTAGFANSFANWRWAVFFFGIILLFMCWLTIERAYYKYDNAIRIILTYDFDGNSTPYYMQKLLKRRTGFGIFGKLTISRWMVYYVPLVCGLFLLMIGILILTGVIVSPSVTP